MDGGVFIATLIIGILFSLWILGSDSERFMFHMSCCPFAVYVHIRTFEIVKRIREHSEEAPF
jgi:hypothetical protein